MRLRTRIALAVGLAAAGLVVALWIPAASRIRAGSEALERTEAERCLARARAAYDAELATLVTASADWAQWDDTWTWLGDRNAAYSSSNLTPQTLGRLRVQALLITDIEFVPATLLTTIEPAPVGLVPALAALARQPAGAEGLRHGCFAAEGALWLTALRPVVRSDGGGTPAGWLAFVRRLDHHVIARIADLAGVPVALAPADLPAGIADAGTTLRAHLPVIGSDGSRLATLTATIDRGISREGARSSWLLLGLLAGAGSAAALLVGFLLEAVVARRVRALGRELDAIAAAADPHRRVAVTGRDELGALETSINATLESLATAQREAAAARERAESAERAEADFLARMSHEIRTPMNAVIGLATLLDSAPLSPGDRQRLDLLRGAADDLLHLINSILDLSKLDADKLDLERAAFDPVDVAARALLLLAAKAEERGLHLRLEPAADVPTEVVGDPHRLRQVLVNLVGNAVKFTERGEVAVTIAAEPAVGGWRLHLAVHDTGPGIDEATAARLFAPFAQADAGLARRHGGTGLGLAISRKLARLMGGDLTLASAPGRGSTFTAMVLVGAGVQRRPLAGRRCLVACAGSAAAASALAVLRWAGADADGCPPAELPARLDGADVGMVITDAEAAAAVHAALGARDLPLVLLHRLTRRPEPPRGRRALLLPLPPAPAELIAAVLQPTARNRPPSGTRSLAVFSGSVLLVEDNATNREVARGLLARHALEPDVAADGASAVALATARPYDLVLMDLQLPDMDGLATTRAIQVACARLGRPAPRIVALTANADDATRGECLAAGMAGFLSKPIRAEALAAALADHLAPPPPHTSSVSACLEELRTSAGADVVAAAVAAFLSDAPAGMAALAAALAAGDLEQARRHAHTLKGECATLGLTATADACAGLLEAARAGDVAGARMQQAAVAAAFAIELPEVSAARTA